MNVSLPLAMHLPFFDESLFLCGGGAFAVLFLAVIAYFVSDALAAVPPEYRQDMTPGQVWLLLIPIFGLVWNFFVFPRVARSFQSCLQAIGRPQPGYYGAQMSLIFSILAACSLVPCVGWMVGLAALVLAILLVVKFQGYKAVLIDAERGGFPVIPPSQPPR